MTDDAHGLGVLGHGRGSSFADGAPVAVPLQMGTLSKALGSYGGYLCAAAPVIELMKSRARPLIYSTGLPPASVAAAIAALDVIAREPGLTELPLTKARRFTDARRSARRPKPDRAGDHRRRAARRSRPRACSKTKASSSRRSARRPCPTARRGCASPSAPQHPDDAIERLAGLIRDRICCDERLLRHRQRDRIGKTFVTAALIRHLRRRGRPSRAEAGRERLRSRRIPRTAIPACCSPRWASR